MENTLTAESIRLSLTNKKAVLLYFFSDKCSVCISLRPAISALVDEKFPQMEKIFISGEQYPHIAADFGVYAAPSILVFFEGKEFIRRIKIFSIGELDRQITRIYLKLLG